MSVTSCCYAFFVLFFVFFSQSVLPLNLICLHCLLHIVFEHLYNLYYIRILYLPDWLLLRDLHERDPKCRYQAVKNLAGKHYSFVLK